MRTVFAGGRVFDGTGAAVAEADVAVVDGRIDEVGVGLDGDEQIDVGGSTLLPGLFDTHVHVMFGHVDVWRLMQEPFSYRFYDAIRNLESTLRIGITTVRDAGGADLGVKKALEEGIAFAENLNPIEAVPDERGAVREMIFRREASRGTGVENDWTLNTVLPEHGVDAIPMDDVAQLE